MFTSILAASRTGLGRAGWPARAWPMTRWAVLLKGVNVGRAKRVPMAEFRQLLTELGYTEVQTLLNSGNAVFTGPARTRPAHAERIRAALAEKLAVDAPVIVKSAAELEAIGRENPLQAVPDPSRLLVAFAADAAGLAALAALAPLVHADEQWHIGAHAAYLWCPQGILASKAAEALLGRIGRAVTTRNVATLEKLVLALKQAA